MKLNLAYFGMWLLEYAMLIVVTHDMTRKTTKVAAAALKYLERKKVI